MSYNRIVLIHFLRRDHYLDCVSSKFMSCLVFDPILFKVFRCDYYDKCDLLKSKIVKKPGYSNGSWLLHLAELNFVHFFIPSSLSADSGRVIFLTKKMRSDKKLHFWIEVVFCEHSNLKQRRYSRSRKYALSLGEEKRSHSPFSILFHLYGNEFSILTQLEARLRGGISSNWGLE